MGGEQRMTRVILLERLRDFTLDATKDILMPVRRQREDKEPPADRAATVYLTRLVKSSEAQKATPYILHQVITGKDLQSSGQDITAETVVRSIFAVYNDNEQEGGLMLLNLMERVRVALLKKVVIGQQFQLDLTAGLETLIYPDDTAPYYAGEMISVWRLPAVEREVNLYGTIE